MRLRLLTKNIFDHTAVMAAIQRLRLAIVKLILICFFNLFKSVTFVSYERPYFSKYKLTSMGYSQVNCTNQKTGIDSEITELKIFKIHI